MSGTVNRVILIGHLGQDPEVKQGRNGSFADLSIATSKTWRDKDSGLRKEQTTWHRVRVFQEHLVKFAGDRLKKGMKVYIEAELQTRTYDKDGEKRYMTEVVLTGFNARLESLQSLGAGSGGASPDEYGTVQEQRSPADRQRERELDDDIPF